jgi:hypothetical protein
MVNTYINLESKESSTHGDSNKGSCSAAPHTGAAGKYPDEQGAGEAPFFFWEQHLSPGSLSLENLGVLAEKVGTLFFKVG